MAERARRLARWLSDEPDKLRLLKYADELEAQAHELERGLRDKPERK